MVIASASSTAFAEVSHLLINIRLKVSFVPLLIHDATVPGNVGALSGRHVLKVPLSLTLVEVLAVGIQLALAPRMRMLLGMSRDWACSFRLAFPGRTSIVVVPLLAFLVVFVVVIVVGFLPSP